MSHASARYGAHPRLYLDEDEAQAIAQRIQRDPVYRAGWARIQTEADSLLKSPLLEEEACADPATEHPNHHDAAQHALRCAEVLGFAYLVSGDQRYLERTREVLLHYSRFESWVRPSFGKEKDPPWRSALDTAEFSKAFGTGYDFIYSSLRPDERRTVREALIQKGILPLVNDWVNPGTRIHVIDSMGHNWWSVCTGGAGIGALALMDEWPQARAWVEIIWDAFRTWFAYAGNVLLNKSRNFGRDGGFYESAGYTSYAIRYYLYFFDALSRSPLKGLVQDAPDLSVVRDFYLHTWYKANQGFLSVGFGDSSSTLTLGSSPEILALARMLKDPHLQWLWRAQRESPQSPHEMLWYDDSVEPKSVEELVPSRVFKDIGWAILRSGWKTEDTLFALKCGDTWNHAHADAASFVLYANGEPLVVDPGSCPYEFPEYRRYYLQSLAHNVVLFDGRGQDPTDLYRGAKFRGELRSFIDTAGYKYLLADATGPFADLYKRYYRHVLVFPKIIILIDDLLAYKEGCFEWLLHTAGEATVKDQQIDVRNGPAGLRISMTHPAALTPQIREGLIEQTREKTGFLSMKQNDLADSTKFIAVMCPYRTGEESKLPLVAASRSESLLRVALDEPGTSTGTYIICNLWDDGRRMHQNGNNSFECRGATIETDGFITTLTYRGDELRHFSLHNTSYFRIDGRVVFDSIIKADVVFQAAETGSQFSINARSKAVVRLSRPAGRLRGAVRRVLLDGKTHDLNYEEDHDRIKLQLPGTQDQYTVEIINQ